MGQDDLVRVTAEVVAYADVVLHEGEVVTVDEDLTICRPLLFAKARYWW